MLFEWTVLDVFKLVHLIHCLRVFHALIRRERNLSLLLINSPYRENQRKTGAAKSLIMIVWRGLSQLHAVVCRFKTQNARSLAGRILSSSSPWNFWLLASTRRRGDRSAISEVNLAAGELINAVFCIAVT